MRGYRYALTLITHARVYVYVSIAYNSALYTREIGVIPRANRTTAESPKPRPIVLDSS